ncbi:MAG: SdiA-regulated domain-containing protein [Lewinellaceae bacterium]|nr:SdiA-regulated domain-containing protein [Saprospiraceae bacterium]MCB9316011.1 SdiA-regulated domain-containing protein [Lewinellaceae bacterium]MCB9330061.1 SdiA-regulated domain-containing protein [Lewinellaceae bacterium]
MAAFAFLMLTWVTSVPNPFLDFTKVQTGQPDTIPYRLDEPSLIVNLGYPGLKEISGLSPSGEPGLFCAISDEKGEVLFIDITGGGAIKRRVLFRDKGDFEGVEKVDDCLYAIKSDGDLYMVRKWKHGKPKSKKYKTGLKKADDVEGLGFDNRRNALLVACKGNPDSSAPRLIFAFDLKTKLLNPKPVYSIDPLEVNKAVPYDDDDKKHFFSASGVAIHPFSGDVYVISTALKRLIVLDYKTGKMLAAARLNKKMLPQPEGIAFDQDGNLFISSEAKKGEDAMLLRFDYQKRD